MSVMDAISRKIIEHAATDPKTGTMNWAQALDFCCTLLGITERHIDIDSARAVIHVRFTRFNQQRTLDVTFNDIAVTINGPAGGPRKPAAAPRVAIGQPLRGGSAGVATSPP